MIGSRSRRHELVANEGGMANEKAPAPDDAAANHALLKQHWRVRASLLAVASASIAMRVSYSRSQSAAGPFTGYAKAGQVTAMMLVLLSACVFSQTLDHRGTVVLSISLAPLPMVLGPVNDARFSISQALGSHELDAEKVCLVLFHVVSATNALWLVGCLYRKRSLNLLQLCRRGARVEAAWLAVCCCGLFLWSRGSATCYPMTFGSLGSALLVAAMLACVGFAADAILQSAAAALVLRLTPVVRLEDIMHPAADGLPSRSDTSDPHADAVQRSATSVTASTQADSDGHLLPPPDHLGGGSQIDAGSLHLLMIQLFWSNSPGRPADPLPLFADSLPLFARDLLRLKWRKLQEREPLRANQDEAMAQANRELRGPRSRAASSESSL